MSVSRLGKLLELQSVGRLSYWTTRGVWAIVDQALFALSNLLLNVLLARWLSPRDARWNRPSAGALEWMRMD